MSNIVHDKVAWTEGVLLLPQHFQQLDRYHESLLSFRLGLVEPLSWGVAGLELDGRALGQGVVSLVSFDGVLPDGTPLRLGAQGGALPTPRSVQGHFSPSRRALGVYLAVPQERVGSSNFVREGTIARYMSAVRPVFDLAADDRSSDVALARPNVSLLLEGEPLDGFATLQIAELVRDERGELALSETYIPPLLRIAASPVMMSHVDRLVRSMHARHRALTQARRVMSDGRVECTAAELTKYLQLSALNGFFPAMHYLARSGDASPRTAYLLLSVLAGQLATFSTKVDMSQPLDLHFDDLRRTFHALFSTCELLLNVTDPEAYVSCTLEAHGGSRYYGDLQDPRFARCTRFLLVVECGLPRPQVVEEFARRAKLASHGDIELVLSKNIGGIDIAESVQPPPGFPVKPGLVCLDFPSAADDVYWKHVWKDRNLVVWLPPALEQAKPSIQLVGLFGSP